MFVADAWARGWLCHWHDQSNKSTWCSGILHICAASCLLGKATRVGVGVRGMGGGGPPLFFKTNFVILPNLETPSDQALQAAVWWENLVDAWYSL